MTVSSNPLNYSGKTVLVTGGGVGIGRGIADAFAQAGATLIIAEIDADRAAAVRAAHPAAQVVVGDVLDRATPALLVETVKAVSGKLDVLVNNVGHFVHALPFDLLDGDQIDEILDVNIGQLLRMTSTMLPMLRAAAPGSCVINVTSIEAYRGIPYCSVYAAAKAGIAGFTKSLALIPLGRFGTPDDCAGAALYLASPLAAWVTGTAIHVDGGALAAAGWTRTPTGEWTIVPMVTGNGLKIPGR